LRRGLLIEGHDFISSGLVAGPGTQSAARLPTSIALLPFKSIVIVIIRNANEVYFIGNISSLTRIPEYSCKELLSYVPTEDLVKFNA